MHRRFHSSERDAVIVRRAGGWRKGPRPRPEPPSSNVVISNHYLQSEAPMSDFIFLYRNSPAAREAAMGTPEQRQKSMQRWMAWMRDLEGKGHLKKAGEPLDRSGKVVRGGSKAVTDGPFVEAKDVIGGYSIIEARDLAQAAELAKGCPALDGAEGSVEVRPVMKLEM